MKTQIINIGAVGGHKTFETVIILTASISSFAGVSALAIQRSRYLARNIKGKNVHINPNAQRKSNLN